MQMVGKPYREYGERLSALHRQMDGSRTAEEADRLLEQVREVARVSAELCWQLEAEWFEINYKHREQVRFLPGATYKAEDAVADMWGLVEKARECEDTFIRPRILYRILDAYRTIIKNYELAFDCGRVLTEELERVRAVDYPEKLKIYIQIGELYYSFRDYEEATFYFEKVLEERDTVSEYGSLAAAYNSLGLVARNYHNDLERSNEYYHKIFTLESVLPPDHYRAWEGIASSNLARNLTQVGQYEEAIPLFQKGVTRLLEIDDYVFVSNSASSLADVYIKTNRLREAKEMLDVARECIEKSLYTKRYHLYYPVLSRYYAALGDGKRAIAYMDSAMVAQENFNNQFNAMQLIRSEQRAYLMEQRAQEEELRFEQERNADYRRTIWIVSLGLLVVLGLLSYSFYLYRRKQAAYKALVRRTREWAEKPITFTPEEDICAMQEPLGEVIAREEAEPQDKQLAAEIQCLIESQKLYLDPAFTLDNLADRMAVNRSYISKAINRQMGKNFTEYINAFRVQEAVRTLSKPSSASLSIDHIAAQAGFNDRKSFHRVFKRLTGLSPSDYRRGNY